MSRAVSPSCAAGNKSGRCFSSNALHGPESLVLIISSSNERNNDVAVWSARHLQGLADAQPAPGRPAEAPDRRAMVTLFGGRRSPFRARTIERLPAPRLAALPPSEPRR